MQDIKCREIIHVIFICDFCYNPLKNKKNEWLSQLQKNGKRMKFT